MSGTNDTITSVTGTSTLVRPRFGPGMLLQHEDLEDLSGYARDLNRLLFRSLFGCGVVCGLVVTTDEKCGKASIIVGAGIALDCCGDPIYVPKDWKVSIDENCSPNIKPPLWVVLCKTSKCCAPRTSMCSMDDDPASICTRERDGFEIRILSKRPACACGCPEPDDSVKYTVSDECKCIDPDDPYYKECYQDHYDGKCGCTCDDCAGGACDCDCVLLARLDRADDDEDTPWTADHRVRRFIRPVLMRDPQVELEYLAQTAAAGVQAEEKKESAKVMEDVKVVRGENRALKTKLAEARREIQALEKARAPKPVKA